MQGGPSQVDTFDCKPRLAREDGQMRSFDDARTFARTRSITTHRVMKSPWRFRQYGESGRWVQYREGYRDPTTGFYTVSLWEQRQWTNNKGTIDLKRTSLRVFAFGERRLGGTDFYEVEPKSIVELKAAPEVGADESALPSTKARRLTVKGRGETGIGALDRVLVVVGYATVRVEVLRDGARLGVIDDLYVEPGARSVGVGEAMMGLLLEWCRDQGCRGVDALALPGMRATKNFFEESGFSARLIVMHHRMADAS